MEGIERIKQLAAEIKDEALLEIINYLTSREDMNEKYLNEEKSLKQMVDFIKSKAKEKAKDGMAMIKDDVVFGWAIHYFDETNENLGLNTKPVKVESAPTQNETSDTNEEIEKIEIKNKPVHSSKKKYVAEGQLTLF